MAFYRPQRQRDELDTDLSPDDLRSIARKENLDRTPFDVETLVHRLHLVLEKAPLEDEISGFIERRGPRWFIGVNSLHHPNRQRFTIAHELGHYCLHRDQIDRLVEKILFRDDGGPDNIEWQANQFAARLLMPQEEIRLNIQSGIREIDELARKFGVSSLAMQFRLRNLGYRLAG
jgi:Zn-dependent peptidase ImmA (M78 family)